MTAMTLPILPDRITCSAILRSYIALDAPAPPTYSRQICFASSSVGLAASRFSVLTTAFRRPSSADLTQSTTKGGMRLRQYSLWGRFLDSCQVTVFFMASIKTPSSRVVFSSEVANLVVSPIVDGSGGGNTTTEPPCFWNLWNLRFSYSYFLIAAKWAGISVMKSPRAACSRCSLSFSLRASSVSCRAFSDSCACFLADRETTTETSTAIRVPRAVIAGRTSKPQNSKEVGSALRASATWRIEQAIGPASGQAMASGIATAYRLPAEGGLNGAVQR